MEEVFFIEEMVLQMQKETRVKLSILFMALFSLVFVVELLPWWLLLALANFWEGEEFFKNYEDGKFSYNFNLLFQIVQKYILESGWQYFKVLKKTFLFQSRPVHILNRR